MLTANSILSQVESLKADGLWLEAFDLLEQARKQMPTDRAIVKEYVSWLRKRSMDTEALSEVRRWLRSHDDMDFRLQEIGLLRDLLKPREAKVAAERVLAKSPENTLAIATYGWGLVNTGDIERGNKILRDALDVHPTDTNILFEHLKARLDARDLDGAIGPLSVAAVENPSDVLTHIYLGRAYRAAGRLEEAMEQAKLAEELEGPTFRVRYLVGRIEVDFGNYDLALDIGKSLVAGAPRDVQGHKLCAFALLGQGQFESALGYARSAMKAAPQNSEATYLFSASIKKLPRSALLKLIFQILWQGLKDTAASLRHRRTA